MFPGRRRRGGRGNFGVMLLFFQLIHYGFDKIPPVTLVTILGQVAIFLRLGDFMRHFPSTQDVCISSFLVLTRRQWSRLLLGAVFHANDMHLYFNMVSMLWKGSVLERKFQSGYFAYLLAVFTLASSAMFVALNHTLAEFVDGTYNLQCAVGFSGVLFGLKVVSIHYTPNGLHYVLGFIPVPSKYIYWVELALIQMVHPQASFTGHLAGILVGLLYIQGPLKAVMDSFLQPGPWYTYTVYTRDGRRTRSQGYTSGGLSEEEQIRRAMEESRHDAGSRRGPSERLYPDLEELRRRRAERYT